MFFWSHSVVGEPIKHYDTADDKGRRGIKGNYDFLFVWPIAREFQTQGNTEEEAEFVQNCWLGGWWAGEWKGMHSVMEVSVAALKEFKWTCSVGSWK